MLAPKPVFVVGVREVAQHFNLSLSWAREAMASGKITSAKIGSQWRTSWDHVAAYVEAHTVHAEVPVSSVPGHPHDHRLERFLNGVGR